MLVLQAHFSVLEGDGECGSLGDVTCAIWMLFTRLFQSAWFQKARTHAHTLAMLLWMAVAGFAAPPVAWNTSSTTLRLNDEPAVLRGVVVSCLEFACDGQGRPSNCAQVLHDRDVEAIWTLLLASSPPATAPPVGGVLRTVPTVRLALTAEFYLGTQCRPAGMSYAELVDSVTTRLTEAGIVVILDLHWNFRSLAQTSMALSDNSVAFWSALSAKYAANPLVLYEVRACDRRAASSR